MTDFVPLIQMKLFRPPLQPTLVARPRLIDRLNNYWRFRPITLISAPAGYGKSILASMWLHNCNSPSAWISLDESDNDPYVFITYLLAAIKQVFPELTLSSAGLLEASSSLPFSILVRHLMNDLTQIDTPYILALDDTHVIKEKSIWDLFTSLLTYPLPNLHLVLIGRHDPPLSIASLRAYERITEIRIRDLRFTTSETAEFLGKALHENVTEEIAREWIEKTEGWATALHLAALFLQHRQKTKNPTRIPEENRYIKGYLLAEVLTQLAPIHREWLLKISLLDRFCAALAEVVCHEESTAESMTGEAFIEWLQQANLFLIGLDQQGEWFRFHHLFRSHLRDSLKEQLSPNQLADLHRRASLWFAANGRFEEAIHHALLGEDIETATNLLAQERYELMKGDHWNSLERLLSQIPDATVAHDAILLLTKAHIAALRGKGAELITSRDRAERLIADLPPDSSVMMAIQGELAVVNSLVAIYAGQTADIIANAQKANELLPKEALTLRTIAIGAQSAGFQMTGNLDQGLLLIKETLSDPIWPPNTHAKLLLYLGMTQFIDADLVGAKRHIGESLHLSNNHKLSDAISQAHYFLGTISYLQNDLTEAEANLLKLLENPALHVQSALAHAVFILSRIYIFQNNPEEASRILDLASTLFEEVANWSLLEVIRAFKVELALDQGNIIEAQFVSSQVDFGSRPPLWFYYVPQLTPIKLLLAQQTTAHLEEALSNLEQLEEYLHALNRKTIRIDVLAMQALAYEAQGNWQKAEAKLIAALRLAKPGNFIRNFIDLGLPLANLLTRLVERNNTGIGDLLIYIARIQDAFQPKQSHIQTSSKQNLQIFENPLTRREQEILRLLATGMSIEEIGLKLTLAVSTVRTHNRNIYAKLGVRSRSKAVQSAKELELL